MNSILPPVENPDAPHLQNQSIGDWFKKESELLKRHYGLEDQLELIFDKPKMWTHYCFHEKTEIEVGKGEDCNWCGQQEGAQELMKTPTPDYSTNWSELSNWEEKNNGRCFLVITEEEIQERLEEEVTTKELSLIRKKANIFLAIDDIWRQYDTSDSHNHLVDTIIDHIKKEIKVIEQKEK